MSKDEKNQMEEAQRKTEGTEGESKASSKAPRRGPGRMSAKRKREAVLRLLRGEDLETLSRELCVTAAILSEWRESFLAAGEASLKTRPGDASEEEIARLQAKVGELTMDNELLYEKIHRMEGKRPFRPRRSRK